MIALDSSPAAIDFLKQKFRDIDEFKAVLTGTETINPGDESVDYAFTYLFLHRTENPKEMVKEIFRILKHGGKAAVIDILQSDSNVPVMSSKGMLHGFSFPDLYEWFINAGFRNISIEKMDHSVFQTDAPDGEFRFDTFIACGEK